MVGEGKRQPLAVSVEDASQVIGLGRTRIYELVKAGLIEAQKDGKLTLLMM